MASSDQAAAPVVEEKKVVEPPKELEENAKKDASPKIKDTVTFLTPDTTLNVLPATVGNMLVAMGEGGLSQLVAGARASVGVKSGRYMFEAKIIEKTGQKSMLRVGFSAEGSLFLGEDENSICFDNEAMMLNQRKKTKCSMPFDRDTTVAVVLNLDEKSANANTISFFKDGVRVSQPQALPDNLKGKTLFPAVSFKSCTVALNFGAPVVPLPFTCKVIQEAVQKEAVVTKYDEPADGKYTALFPVSLPDEGTFDWLDSFLEKNPGYTELSDRAFTAWGMKSGLQANKRKASNDKPDMGIQGLEKMDEIKRALMQVAAIQPRNFVVMEVKGNLVKEERVALLAKFKTPVFKTVAEIVVGETPPAFKKIVQTKVLENKQMLADREFRTKAAEERRQWAIRKKTKDAEKAKKKAEKERVKKAAEAKKRAEETMKKRAEEMEAKKKAEAAAAAAAAAGEAAEGEEKKEETKEEEKPEEKEEEKVEEVEEESEEEPDEPEPEVADPPKCPALTAEEKAVKFFNYPVPDMVPILMNTSFVKFSLPEADEGFDAVQYSWNKEKEAAKYMKEWISGKKQTTRVEDIKPSEWFKQKQSQWTAQLNQWKNKQNEYRNMLAKKAADKQAKISKKAAEKAAAEKKALMKANAKKLAADAKAKAAEDKAKAKEEAKAKAEAEGTEYVEPAEEKEEEKPEEEEEEAKPMEVEEEEEPEEPALDFDGVDVFGADDICDVGGKTPVFRDFQFEDFAMLTLRFELHLLVHAFAKDSQDPERKGIHLDHLAFYYQKYFGKNLNEKSFGKETLAELVAMIFETVIVTKHSILESLIPADLETNVVFIKITEEARRARNLRLDMGEDEAKLKIDRREDYGQKRNADTAGKGKWGDGGQNKKGAFDGAFKGKGKGGGFPGMDAMPWSKGFGGMDMMKGGGKDFGKDFGMKGKMPDFGKGGGKDFGKDMMKGKGKW